MPIPELNIDPGVVVVGTDGVIVIPVVEMINGRRVPKNCGSMELEWEVRARVGDLASVISKTTGAGQITFTTSAAAAALGKANDLVNVRYVVGDTYNIGSGAIITPPGNYYHALRRTDPGLSVGICAGVCPISAIASR